MANRIRPLLAGFLCLMLLPVHALALQQSSLQQADFDIVFTVADAAGNTVNLTIGTAADATTGYDPQYDLLRPRRGRPALSMPALLLRMKITSPFSSLLQWNKRSGPCSCGLHRVTAL